MIEGEDSMWVVEMDGKMIVKLLLHMVVVEGSHHCKDAGVREEVATGEEETGGVRDAVMGQHLTTWFTHSIGPSTT